MDESEFESLLRSNAPGKWEQIKKAASIAQEHRRRVKEGDLFVFLFPLAAAIAKDAIFDFIPIAGTIFGAFITVYLFVFMWGRGRLWLRFVFFIIAVLELIPFINLIPFNTASVVYAYFRARKAADQSQAALSDMERQAPRLRSKLQSQAARMARAVALQEERLTKQRAAEAAAGAAASTQAVRAPQMARPINGEAGNAPARSTENRNTPLVSRSSASQSAAQTPGTGTATYAPGKPAVNEVVNRQATVAANDAVMRIRAAGARLAQATPSIQNNARRQPLSGGEMRRAA